MFFPRLWCCSGGFDGGNLYEGDKSSSVLDNKRCMLDRDSWSGNVASDKLNGDEPPEGDK